MDAKVPAQKRRRFRHCLIASDEAASPPKTDDDGQGGKVGKISVGALVCWCISWSTRWYFVGASAEGGASAGALVRCCIGWSTRWYFDGASAGALVRWYFVGASAEVGVSAEALIHGASVGELIDNSLVNWLEHSIVRWCIGLNTRW